MALGKQSIPTVAYATYTIRSQSCCRRIPINETADISSKYLRFLTWEVKFHS